MQNLGAAVESSHVSPPSSAPIGAGHNQLLEVAYKGGWPGLFAGENQQKALVRAMSDLNSQRRVVVAAVADRWSFWRRLGRTLLAIVTLGFVVRVPNVILISAPG